MIATRIKATLTARAFTLIEVTLALGVAGFCLVTVFGLLPVGLTSSQASLEQTTAGNISSAILSDLRCAQPLVAQASPRLGLPIPAADTANSVHTIYVDSGGNATAVDTSPVTSGPSVSRYRATIQFFPPQTATPRNATAVRILITWPALADPNYQSTPTNYTGSYEADTTLDRN